MGRKALIAALCWLTLHEASTKAVKTAYGVGLVDNVSAESVSQLYRDVPVGVYASATPYGAYSFHVPRFVVPNNNRIVPLNEERILAQSTNNFLRDSYGQRYVEAPQAFAYKPALQQQFVPLQKLPAHLSQPLVAAAPNAQYGTHFFGSSPFRLANLQAFAPEQANPFGATQPLVYAENLRALASLPELKPQNNGPPAAQQQSPSNRNVYVNSLTANHYGNVKEQQYQRQEEPKISASDHNEKQHKIVQKLPLVHAPQETTITSVLNGKKIKVNLITKPPIPLLDLTLLEPLTFDNPLVPQVQHFLPKIHQVTYKTLPELTQEAKSKPKKSSKKKTKKHRPKIRTDDVEIIETHTTHPVDDTPIENPEFAHENKSPNYKETVSEKKISYNKHKITKPVHVSYEKNTNKKPVTYSYASQTDTEPVHYDYVENSKKPAQIKKAYNENNKENPKHLIYHFQPDENTGHQDEQHPNPQSESEETSDEHTNESDTDEITPQLEHHHQQPQQHHHHHHQQQPQHHHHQQHEQEKQHYYQPQNHHQPQHHHQQQYHHQPQHQQHQQEQQYNHQPQHQQHQQEQQYNHQPQHHQEYHQQQPQYHQQQPQYHQQQPQYHQQQQQNNQQQHQQQHHQQQRHQQQQLQDKPKHELAEEAEESPENSYTEPEHREDNYYQTSKQESPEPEHIEVSYENSKENTEPEQRKHAYYESPQHGQARQQSPEPIVLKSLVQQEEKQYEAIVPEYEEEDITILPTHKPHSPANSEANYNRDSDNEHNPHPVPHNEQVRDYPKSSYYSSPSGAEEKSSRIIIKDEPPQEEHTPNDELMQAMVKKQEESEEDFEKAYKDAAYGFPAYESIHKVAEAEIYNPDSYGVPRYDYDGQKSELRQYEAAGDLYPAIVRSQYKDARDKTNDEYYANYKASRPDSLAHRNKKKEDYYENYKEHRPQKLVSKEDSDEQQSEKYTVGPSYGFQAPQQKHQFAKYISKITPLDEYNYVKEAPPHDSSAFASGSYKSKTQFLTPHYQYGFAPIRVTLDNELAAMASNDSPESEKPGRKKMYKENFYIKKTSITKGGKVSS